jgi:hypothetical protein
LVAGRDHTRVIEKRLPRPRSNFMSLRDILHGCGYGITEELDPFDRYVALMDNRCMFASPIGAVGIDRKPRCRRWRY